MGEWRWREPKAITARNAGTGEDGKRRRYNVRFKEWMPKPMSGKDKLHQPRTNGEPIYVQIVPGPNRTFQIVRVELATPVARGFKSKEQARKWIELALRQGVLPAGITELEP